MIDAMDKKLVRSLNANARKSFARSPRSWGRRRPRSFGRQEAGVQRAVRVISGGRSAAFGYDLTVVVLMAINQGQLLETSARSPRTITSIAS